MRKSTEIDRRKFLVGTTALAGASLAAPAVLRAADKELRILTWEGYAEPEWLDPFKQATGATVNIVYSGSADEMFAKMQGSQGADFDLVSFDTSLFPRYVDAKLIQPFDMAKDPELRRILRRNSQMSRRSKRGDKQFGMPFAWGSLPLVYDATEFPTAPDSWEVMWDPQICPADALAGRCQQLDHAGRAHRRRRESLQAHRRGFREGQGQAHRAEETALDLLRGLR